MSDEELYQQRISMIKILLREQRSPEEIFNTLSLGFSWYEPFENLMYLIKSELKMDWNGSKWTEANTSHHTNDESTVQEKNTSASSKRGPGRPKNEPVSHMTQKQYEDLREILCSMNAKLEENTKSISELKSVIDALNKNNPYKELSEQSNKFFDIFISDSAKKSVYINSRLIEQVKNIMSKKMKKNANTSNVLNAALLDVILRNKEK